MVVLSALMAEWMAALLALTFGGAWLWVVLNFVLGALAGGVAESLTARRWCFWQARTGLVLAASRWATFALVPDLFAHERHHGTSVAIAALLAPSLLAYLAFAFKGRQVRRPSGLRTGFVPDSSGRA